MSEPQPPTFDQLSVFLAIVESGSFAGAARKLGRAASVVSYSIANLEDRLGVRLFVREGTRRPVLTEEGRAILADSRIVQIGLDGLLAKARGLTQGLEAEVSLVVDVMWPACRLVAALDDFRARFPTVALRLAVEALGAVTQIVQEGRAAFGVSGPLEPESDLLIRAPAGAVRLVPVAAPSHPLAMMAAPVTPAAVRAHVQLVLTDRSPLTAGRDFGVLGVSSWRLADLGAKHALLLAGLGWGSMPEDMIAKDLKEGRLARLRIAAWDETLYHFHTVHRRDAPPGPAARWLMQRLAG